jgi:hypothetical protein
MHRAFQTTLVERFGLKEFNRRDIQGDLALFGHGR